MKKLVFLLVAAIFTCVETRVHADVPMVPGPVPVPVIDPKFASLDIFKTLRLPTTDNNKADEAVKNLHHEISVIVTQDFKDINPSDIAKLQKIIDSVEHETKALSLVDNQATMKAIVPFLMKLKAVVSKKKSELVPLSLPLTPLQPAQPGQATVVPAAKLQSAGLGLITLQKASDAIKGVIHTWHPKLGIIPPEITKKNGQNFVSGVTTQSLIGGKAEEIDYCKAICANPKTRGQFGDDCYTCLKKCYEQSNLPTMPGFDDICRHVTEE